jgi:DNA-binding MarR family transcriptional regulator
MINKRKRLVSLLFNSGRMMKDHFHFEAQGGFTILHIETMRFIEEMKNPSMKDVANHLHITPASASSLIDGLVEEKLLTRFEEKKDRRIVRIKPTAKGARFLKLEFKKINGKMEELFKKLNDTEVETFIKILEKFIKN